MMIIHERFANSLPVLSSRLPSSLATCQKKVFQVLSTRETYPTI